ncbi:MAG TPA: carbamoyltransferase N-terminal domain-containing protein, partial [Ignavibacteriaceae bacterium]|nr:carbamoyltransferase N-terminal domain-containing protein [Ignavibacteriaceae bacterium]
MKKPVKRILGISALDKDATACIYSDGDWKAIAEERLSRVKMQDGFPKLSIRELLKSTGLKPEDLDQVVYPFMPWWVEGSSMLYGYLRDLPFALTNNTPWNSKRRHLKAYWKWCMYAISDHRRYHNELNKELSSLGINQKLTRIEHHNSHVCAAYLTSGFDEALALTLDWYGGGLSGSINFCSPNEIKRIYNFRYPHSMGLFYSQVTSALGFKSSQHEGKIVGLAAFGDSNKLGPELLKRFVCKNGNFQYCSGMDPEFSKDLAKKFPREDVAAAYQYVLETVICRIASYWLKKTGLQNVV